jgi:hypothetical protein
MVSSSGLETDSGPVEADQRATVWGRKVLRWAGLLAGLVAGRVLG